MFPHYPPEFRRVRLPVQTQEINAIPSIYASPLNSNVGTNRATESLKMSFYDPDILPGSCAYSNRTNPDQNADRSRSTSAYVSPEDETFLNGSKTDQNPDNRSTSYGDADSTCHESEKENLPPKWSTIARSCKQCNGHDTRDILLHYSTAAGRREYLVWEPTWMSEEDAIRKIPHLLESYWDRISRQMTGGGAEFPYPRVEGFHPRKRARND